MDPYRTARLQLRDLQEGDEQAVFTLLGDLRVVQFMAFPLFTRERAERFVARARDMRAAQPLTNFVLAITDASDPARGPIGLAGLVIDGAQQSGEAWYLTAPEYWGRGYVTEAGGALLAIGFGELGLRRIWATCLPENPASARVLEKLGFRLEGFQLENVLIQGQWRDCRQFALLRREWEAFR